MGSTISRTAQRAAPQARKTPSSPSVAAGEKGAIPKTEKMTIPLSPPPASGVVTKSSAEWGDLLKRVSGVIETTSWDDVDGTAGVKGGDGRGIVAGDGKASRHAAQRSLKVSSKLPTFRNWQVPKSGKPSENELSIDAQGRTVRPRGKLVAEDVLDLFRRRRNDPQNWDISRIASEFNLDADDAKHLLKFTRTYMGRTDLDGVLRAYYNPDRMNTIQRFERD